MGDLAQRGAAGRDTKGVSSATPLEQIERICISRTARGSEIAGLEELRDLFSGARALLNTLQSFPCDHEGWRRASEEDVLYLAKNFREQSDRFFAVVSPIISRAEQERVARSSVSQRNAPQELLDALQEDEPRQEPQSSEGLSATCIRRWALERCRLDVPKWLFRIRPESMSWGPSVRTRATTIGGVLRGSLRPGTLLSTGLSLPDGAEGALIPVELLLASLPGGEGLVTFSSVERVPPDSEFPTRFQEWRDGVTRGGRRGWGDPSHGGRRVQGKGLEVVVELGTDREVVPRPEGYLPTGFFYVNAKGEPVEGGEVAISSSGRCVGEPPSEAASIVVQYQPGTISELPGADATLEAIRGIDSRPRGFPRGAQESFSDFLFTYLSRSELSPRVKALAALFPYLSGAAFYPSDDGVITSYDQAAHKTHFLCGLDGLGVCGPLSFFASNRVNALCGTGGDEVPAASTMTVVVEGGPVIDSWGDCARVVTPGHRRAVLIDAQGVSAIDLTLGASKGDLLSPGHLPPDVGIDSKVAGRQLRRAYHRDEASFQRYALHHGNFFEDEHGAFVTATKEQRIAAMDHVLRGRILFGLRSPDPELLPYIVRANGRLMREVLASEYSNADDLRAFLFDAMVLVRERFPAEVTLGMYSDILSQPVFSARHLYESERVVDEILTMAAENPHQVKEILGVVANSVSCIRRISRLSAVGEWLPVLEKLALLMKNRVPPDEMGTRDFMPLVAACVSEWLGIGEDLKNRRFVDVDTISRGVNSLVDELLEHCDSHLIAFAVCDSRGELVDLLAGRYGEGRFFDTFYTDAERQRVALSVLARVVDGRYAPRVMVPRMDDYTVRERFEGGDFLRAAQRLGIPPLSTIVSDRVVELLERFKDRGLNPPIAGEFPVSFLFSPLNWAKKMIRAGHVSSEELPAATRKQWLDNEATLIAQVVNTGEMMTDNGSVTIVVPDLGRSLDILPRFLAEDPGLIPFGEALSPRSPLEIMGRLVKMGLESEPTGGEEALGAWQEGSPETFGELRSRMKNHLQSLSSESMLRFAQEVVTFQLKPVATAVMVCNIYRHFATKKEGRWNQEGTSLIHAYLREHFGLSHSDAEVFTGDLFEQAKGYPNAEHWSWSFNDVPSDRCLTGQATTYSGAEGFLRELLRSLKSSTPGSPARRLRAPTIDNVSAFTYFHQAPYEEAKRGLTVPARSGLVGHTPYSPGVDVRTIDWNKYLSTGSLYVRLGTYSAPKRDTQLNLVISAQLAAKNPDDLCRILSQVEMELRRGGAQGHILMAYRGVVLDAIASREWFGATQAWKRDYLVELGARIGKLESITEGFCPFFPGITESSGREGALWNLMAKHPQGGHTVVVCSDREVIPTQREYEGYKSRLRGRSYGIVPVVEEKV